IRFSDRGSVLEAGRFGFELELLRVVANDADFFRRKPARGFGLDLQREFHLGALGPLKLHHDRIQDGIERLDRANHVDFNRAEKSARISAPGRSRLPIGWRRPSFDRRWSAADAGWCLRAPPV